MTTNDHATRVHTGAAGTDLGLMTAEQAAPLFHLSTERFREQVRRPTSVPKPLPKPIKVGRRLLWRRTDLEAWTAEVFGGTR